MFASSFLLASIAQSNISEKLSSSDGPSVFNSSARTQTHVINSAYIAKTQLYNKLYAFSYLLDSQIYCNILVLHNSSLNDKHKRKNKPKVDIKRNKELPL